jgi:hypothetical protein
MTERAELLDYADQVLDGTVGLGARSARTAALLARCAFEEWLDETGKTWERPSHQRPSTESKLVVLRALRGEAVGETAVRAWAGLSRACHHHAYELQPSVMEVRHLIGEVRKLEALASAD